MILLAVTSFRHHGEISRRNLISHYSISKYGKSASTLSNRIGGRKELFTLSATEEPGAEDQTPETETENPKPSREISNSMKERLRAELRSQGADPNYSAGPILGNPILLISFVITFLVLIGGKGYFF